MKLAPLVALALSAVARVEAAPPPPPATPPPVALADAVTHFEAGEYPGVIAALKPVVDVGAIRDPVQRAQALRIYGIACYLTGDPLAAQAAFTQWLQMDPRARLDATLVRPEVVAFFNNVRVDLAREVERRRPRTAALNLLPPAGQYQNNQRTKFATLLGLEVGLLGVNIGSAAWIYSDRRADGTFADEGRARALSYVNWASAGLLGATLLYGIVDGFANYYRLVNGLDRDERVLTADNPRRGL